jgi:hypothetical protein
VIGERYFFLFSSQHIVKATPKRHSNEKVLDKLTVQFTPSVFHFLVSWVTGRKEERKKFQKLLVTFVDDVFFFSLMMTIFSRVFTIT